MSYETCADVSVEFWEKLTQHDPGEISGRTGVEFREGRYRVPFLNRELVVDPETREIRIEGQPEVDPGFRVCLTTLVYLLQMDPAGLRPPISPLELAGGATFFRGHHGLPNGPLEARFGQDRQGLVAAGDRLQAAIRPAGDAAVALTVYPGVVVEVILWEGDEEFPAQVTFTVPGHLDRFWHLDAVWGLLNLVATELLVAAQAPSP